MDIIKKCLKYFYFIIICCSDDSIKTLYFILGCFAYWEHRHGPFNATGKGGDYNKNNR